jgi:hypothetical protein
MTSRRRVEAVPGHRRRQRPRRSAADRRPRLRGPYRPVRRARVQPRGRRQPAGAQHPGAQAHKRLLQKGLQHRGDGRAPCRRPHHRPLQVSASSSRPMLSPSTRSTRRTSAWFATARTGTGAPCPWT